MKYLFFIIFTLLIHNLLCNKRQSFKILVHYDPEQNIDRNDIVLIIYFLEYFFNNSYKIPFSISEINFKPIDKDKFLSAIKEHKLNNLYKKMIAKKKYLNIFYAMSQNDFNYGDLIFLSPGMNFSTLIHELIHFLGVKDHNNFQFNLMYGGIQLNKCLLSGNQIKQLKENLECLQDKIPQNYYLKGEFIDGRVYTNISFLYKNNIDTIKKHNDKINPCHYWLNTIKNNNTKIPSDGYSNKDDDQIFKVTNLNIDSLKMVVASIRDSAECISIECNSYFKNRHLNLNFYKLKNIFIQAYHNSNDKYIYNAWKVLPKENQNAMLNLLIRNSIIAKENEKMFDPLNNL